MHFLYGPGQISIKSVFPGLYTIFGWFPQKCKIWVFLYLQKCLIPSLKSCVSLMMHQQLISLLTASCCNFPFFPLTFKTLTDFSIKWIYFQKYCTLLEGNCHAIQTRVQPKHNYYFSSNCQATLWSCTQIIIKGREYILLYTGIMRCCNLQFLYIIKFLLKYHYSSSCVCVF